MDSAFTVPTGIPMPAACEPDEQSACLLVVSGLPTMWKSRDEPFPSALSLRWPQSMRRRTEEWPAILRQTLGIRVTVLPR